MKKTNILAVALSAGLVLCGGGYYLSNVDVAYAQEESKSLDEQISEKEAEVKKLEEENASKDKEIANLESQKEDPSKIQEQIQKNEDDFTAIDDKYSEKYYAWENAKKTYNEKNDKLQELEKQIEELKDKINGHNFEPGDLDKVFDIDSKAAPLRFEVRDAKADMEEKLAEVKKMEPDFKEARKNYHKKSEELNTKLAEANDKNKKLQEKIDNLNNEKKANSEKIAPLNQEIEELKKAKEEAEKKAKEEAEKKAIEEAIKNANIVGYNYRSVETTKDSDKKEEMGISAETRAKLLEAIRQAEIKIEAVRFLKENTPKTIAKVVDKLDKLVAEQEMLIKEAKEVLAKY